ncbi:MAG TPA: histidine kinase [Aequorivita sp.]|nr:histidine kinase [Aequorivita sp.]
MKKSFLIVFIVLGNLWQLSAQIAADSIVGELKLINNPEVKALRTSLQATFKEVQNTARWEPYDANYENEPKTAIWLKLELENRSNDTLPIYCFTAHDYANVYQQTGTIFKTFKNGNLVPLYKRSNKREFYITELVLPPSQKSQVFIRIHSIKKIKNGNVALFTKAYYLEFAKNYIESEKHSVAFMVFYLLSLFTIFLFGVVFWLRTHQKLYAYYLAYIFFQIVFAFAVLRSTTLSVGNIFLYIPYRFSAVSETSQFLFIGFYIFFIINLLEIKKYNQPLTKALIYFGRFCLLYGLAIYIYLIVGKDSKISSEILAIVRLIVLPLNLVMLIWIIYKVKHPLLKYFVVGHSFFFIGAVLASYVMITKSNYHPESIFNFPYAPTIIFQAGLLAEVFCFAFALGENIFLLQKEKENTSQNLITQLQKNQQLQENMRVELDRKINQKTEELIQLYSKIEKQKEKQLKNSFTQKLLEMEMLALRSQMNPHFLFNSLNSIKHLIMTSRNEDAITYLDDFSTLLRSILHNSNREIISVEEELEILELYLSLEKSRMGNNFNYYIQASNREELSQFHIPPLLLQPFVENAIWHGLSTGNNPEKTLKVTFDTRDSLKITIEDNGIGRKASSEKKKTQKSMGMKITQERLALYNHSNDTSIHLEIKDLENESIPVGTRVTLTYSY